ncbi:hypothetical protein GF312_15130 [Candidatus Poribacteria bacterium]|nr:hypothetical protein [Candidatus Poribacteria bacterium]
MNKKVVVFLFLIILPSICYSADVIKFDMEFGGKGAGQGAFGKDIKMAFDDEGNIYISDKDNKMLHKLNSEARFLMQIPEDTEDKTLFNTPGDITVDKQGNIYVADWSSKYIEGTENPRLHLYGPCVYKFSSTGLLLNTYFIDSASPKPRTVIPGIFVVDEKGQYGWALRPKGYDRALLVTVDSQKNLYILDVENNIIHKYNPEGERVENFGNYGSGGGEMDSPGDMAADNEDNLIIADTGNNRIIKFDGSGEYILNFGSKGYGTSQFIKPVSLAVTKSNEILVKDSSSFDRIGLKHSFGSERRTLGGEYAIQPVKDSELIMLEERILRLEEALEEGEDAEKAKEKLLAKSSRYYTVIERIQRFSDTGEYRDKAIYKIDKTHRELNDLEFLTLDPMGRIYLMDADRQVIRRYMIDGFTPRLSEIEATYTARTENSDQSFLEDYGDIDEKTDLEDRRSNLAISQALLMNYDISERWNFSLRDTHLYAKRDNTYETPPKPEDNYDYFDNGWDNTLDLNMKYIANPDPYKYREMNFYSEVLTGSTEYTREAMFSNVNLERSEREGDTTGIVFGADIDIHHNINVGLEYLRLKPGMMGSNFTTRLYDVSGDLYQVSSSYNSTNIVVGELNIKF